MPMRARVYGPDGTARRSSMELPAVLFDGTVNEAALHQVVTAYRARQRQGTAATKTRGVVSGGNRKPWRQKGTGRARAGSIRSPLWRGGGKVFGPQPRDHAVRVPKRLKQLATRSALNARAREGNLVIVEELNLEEPSTKSMAGLLTKIDPDARKVLVLTGGNKRNVYLSARNIPGVVVRPWGAASAYEVLWADLLVIEASAVGTVEEPEGDE